MTRQSDEGWRRHVVEQMLPRLDANTGPAATSFQAATDFGPVTFHGDRTPDDPVALLPEEAATKFIALGQRASDLHGAIPKHEPMQELRTEITVLKNRLADLNRPLSEGGSAVPATAWQVADVERQLSRVEKELARRTELKETRTVRWTAAAQLHQGTRDWSLRGIPADCVCDVFPDTPVAELLKKNETLSDGVERYRLRQRECAAERHRVNSQQWPISTAEAVARELIERLADAGRPNLENAIEHNLPISFATTRLTSSVYNVDARGAIAYAEMPDAIGLVCWVLRDQLLAQINAGFREIGDDKNALDQRQREEMLATIDADILSAERAECSLIWAAAERGEIIDFRATTTPAAALGISLRTVPRGDQPQSSWMHAYDIVQPGGGR
jgi:hypothetical protein